MRFFCLFVLLAALLDCVAPAGVDADAIMAMMGAIASEDLSETAASKDDPSPPIPRVGKLKACKEINAKDFDRKHFVKHHVLKSIPLVIRGLAKRLDAYKKWRSNEYLMKKIGSRRVIMDWVPGNETFYKIDLESGSVVLPGTVKAKFSDVLKWAMNKNHVAEHSVRYFSPEDHAGVAPGNPPIAHGAQLYIEPLQAGTMKTGSYTPLLPDTKGMREWLVGGDSAIWPPNPKANLWLSAHGTTRQHKPHWDNYDGVMAVIRGTKVFDLYPPKETKNLYVLGFLSPTLSQTHFTYDETTGFSTAPVNDRSYWTNTQYSIADFYDAADFDAFPKLARVKTGLRCTVRQGDAMFLPLGYWHSKYFICLIDSFVFLRC